VDDSLLLVAKFEVELGQDSEEVLEFDLTVVFSSRVSLQEFDKLAPVCRVFIRHLRVNIPVQFEDLGFVLLQVREAIKGASRGRCPATFLVARRNSLLERVRQVLSEVESLTWVDFVADTLDEVLVRDQTIAVLIEEVIHDFALLLRHREPPMFQEKQQLFLVDVWVVVLVEVAEGFADCVPLLPNLVD